LKTTLLDTTRLKSAKLQKKKQNAFFPFDKKLKKCNFEEILSFLNKNNSSFASKKNTKE